MSNIEAAITKQFDSQRDDAIRTLQSIIATASRELAALEAGTAFIRTDWIEQDAARYHDQLTSMIAISDSLSAAHFYAKQESQS